jgi:hypothetical protein
VPEVNEEGDNEEVAAEPMPFHSVVGAAAVRAGYKLATEFLIRYNSPDGDRFDYDADCWMVDSDEFSKLLVNPPSVDRDSLSWDTKLIGRYIVYLYGKKGAVRWERGRISSFDKNTGVHDIVPDDCTQILAMNLLACKSGVVKEWRFVQPEEDNQLELRAWLNDHLPESDSDTDPDHAQDHAGLQHESKSESQSDSEPESNSD